MSNCDIVSYRKGIDIHQVFFFQVSYKTLGSYVWFLMICFRFHPCNVMETVVFRRNKKIHKNSSFQPTESAPLNRTDSSTRDRIVNLPSHNSLVTCPSSSAEPPYPILWCWFFKLFTLDRERHTNFPFSFSSSLFLLHCSRSWMFILRSVASPSCRNRIQSTGKSTVTFPQGKSWNLSPLSPDPT